MALEISLSPGEGSDTLLIPKIEEIIKVAKGDLGIVDTIKNNLMGSIIENSSFDKESLNIFAQLNGLDMGESEVIPDRNGKVSLPNIDFGNSNDNMGFKPLEKTMFQSLFESQKPYLEGAMLIIDNLVKCEDIIAKVATSISIDGKSLKPPLNENSLYSKKMGVQEDINSIKNLSTKKSVMNDTENDISKNKRYIDRNSTNLNDNTYNWEIVSTIYSTGFKIEGINYRTIYKDIIEERDINLDPNIEQQEEVTIEKPPVIVFAVYDKNGNLVTNFDDMTKSWLTREGFPNYTEGVSGPQTTKWYGQWQQLENDDVNLYKDKISQLASNRIDKKNDNLSDNEKEELLQKVLGNMNFSENLRLSNENCFMNLVRFEEENRGIGLGSDNQTVVNRVTGGRNHMFAPKKINYNDKEVIIDPESDYNLQIIRLIPQNTYYKGSPDTTNQQLKRTSPLVGNYMGKNVIDTLERREYRTTYLNDGYVIRDNEEPMRVQTFPINNNGNQDHLYIVEGIRKKDRATDQQSENESNRFYVRSAFFEAIKDFIDLLIELFSEVVPAISQIIELFKSPHEALINIIIGKLKDNFEIFDPELLEKFSTLISIQKMSERVSFIREEPLLKKYFHVNEENGTITSILDSVAITQLFNFNFGIKMQNLVPSLFLKKDDNNTANNSLNDRENSKRNQNGISNDDSAVRDNFISQNGRYETLSIEYSTGDKIEGVDYEYIYINQEVEKLISEADSLFKIAGANSVSPDTNSALDALANYEIADSKTDNKLISDKITEIKSEFKIGTNAMFKLLQGIISFPIEIIISFFEYIIETFENLSIDNIKESIEDLLSFEWAKDLFSPQGILSIIGININPNLFFEYFNSSDTKREFDLSKVFSVPFLTELPIVNLEQIKEMGSGLLSNITGFLNLIKELISAIVKFIFSILNLEKVLDIPEINLSFE